MILDLGTGTGCLLLAALSEFPAAFGVGVDRSRGGRRAGRPQCSHAGPGGPRRFHLRRLGRRAGGAVRSRLVQPALHPHLGDTAADAGGGALRATRPRWTADRTDLPRSGG